MAYRRKPDTVDAWQYTTSGTPPSWLQTLINQTSAFEDSNGMNVPAPGGQQTAFPGDYVLHDTVTGDVSACPASEFSARWEAIP